MCAPMHKYIHTYKQIDTYSQVDRNRDRCIDGQMDGYMTGWKGEKKIEGSIQTDRQ